MTKKQESIFSLEEQIEIINIVKGIFRYAAKSKNVLSSEDLFLNLLSETCGKVVNVIKEKNEQCQE